MVINGVMFNTDLADIIAELQRELRLNNLPYIQRAVDTGNDIQVCCPYHAGGLEKRPSAGIRKTDGLMHCFACGKVAELQEVITKCFEADDVIGNFGWQWLLKNFATTSVYSRPELQICLSRVTECRKSKDFVSDDILYGYRYYHPYMGKRKLTDEVIDIFDVGYDKETDCITFPNRNRDGNCLFVARRSVKTKYFNYPKDVEKEVYGIYELYSLPEFPRAVYVCESMIDCLTLWTHGMYACALNGLGTDLQFRQLNEMPCRKYILATDSDEAGMKARRVLRKHLKNKLITEIILPKGRKDINECTWEEVENLEEIF